MTTQVFATDLMEFAAKEWGRRIQDRLAHPLKYKILDAIDRFRHKFWCYFGIHAWTFSPFYGEQSTFCWKCRKLKYEAGVKSNKGEKK
jgi:hypothetical protein